MQLNEHIIARRARSSSPSFPQTVYESSSERWSPVQSIEKILLSGGYEEGRCETASDLSHASTPLVLSMLAEPNVESGANIDACKMWRDDRAGYEEKIRADVRRSLGLA